ncbi:hypothetical protein [Streptomyces sp. VNUA24]|uniref:hypothetical protein n=1 Tax=Streptomyces sp. VNUA24 TaxID=3031131 RepID=UPI0023B847C4|nr:hypothetical protein [Streptomyces sp. VNUA24]WEH16616.1 hypothetical protein PYR72_24040 [Streptomyces sp. VNUA24]
MGFVGGSYVLPGGGKLVGMASNQQTRPGIGELAKDRANGRIGVVMGQIGGRVQIRPVCGGREWDAMPGNVVALSAREELSARLAMKNGNSRAGL